MAERKKSGLATKFDVGLVSKPWWNQALIQTCLAGMFLLIGACATAYFSKGRPSFDQSVISNSNVTYIDMERAKIRFNSEKPNLIDIMLPIHVNGGMNTSIYFNRVSGFELISQSQNKENFPILISHLRCDAKYFYRIDPSLEGKPLVGSQLSFSIPPCDTPDQQKKLLQDPHYVDSFYMPNLTEAD